VGTAGGALLHLATSSLRSSSSIAEPLHRTEHVGERAPWCCRRLDTLRGRRRRVVDVLGPDRYSVVVVDHADAAFAALRLAGEPDKTANSVASADRTAAMVRASLPARSITCGVAVEIESIGRHFTARRTLPAARAPA
jgi:hypothetical protein